MRAFPLTTLTLAATTIQLYGACLSLAPGVTLRGSVGRTLPLCVLVSLAPGQATRILVDQPEDLEILISWNAHDSVIDGFDFGRETATLIEPGEYRIHVRASRSLSLAGSITVPVTRISLPLALAQSLREAEEWATKSKRSPERSDIDESLKRWQALNDKPAVARTFIKRGDDLLGPHPAEARTAYGEALSICRALSDPRCTAEAANNSGVAAEFLGDFPAALQYLEEAVTEWRKASQEVLVGRTLSTLGLLFQQAGDFEHAIASYDHARTVLQGHDALAAARASNNLGLTYLSMSEYGKARAYFALALEEFERQRDHRAAIRARLNLARSFMLEGNLSHAQSLLETTLAAIPEGDSSGRADALNNLGQVLLRRHSPQKARERFTAALDLHHNLGDKRGQAYDLHYLGLSASDLGDAASARESLLRALEIRESSGMRDDAADSLFALASLERDHNEPTLAREFAERALKLQELVRSQTPGAALRASFYARKRRFFDLLVDIAVAPADDAAAREGLLASERGRGRALLDLLAEGSLLRQIPPELLKRRTDIQKRMGLISAGLAAADDASPKQDALRRELEMLVAQDEEVEARVRETTETLPLGQPLLSVERLQHEYLPPDSALIEYHLGEQRSYLWLVGHDGIILRFLPPRAELEAMVARTVDLFGRILDRRRSKEKQLAFERDLSQLSAALLSPLKGEHLPARLILAPDGALNRVPFAALRFNRSGEPLGLAHDLIQIPAASYLTAGKKPRPVSAFSRSVLALSDPVFSASDSRLKTTAPPNDETTALDLPRLSFTGDIDAIESLVPAARRRILRGLEVTPASLNRVRLADYAVLHFSTHALIDDRIPEVSRIALSLVDQTGRPVDGFLRPYQLSRFSLDGSIVVLSACDTALGKQVMGEGLLGFTSSLFSAGAAQLVLTLGEVDAEGAAAFLSETYRGYLSGKLAGMERSITQARRALAESARWHDPYYWASFVVLGRPSDQP
ncbi:MAG: CHAT domain-containing protein [Acidobacteriia bacterium]|nr:CHAT domain-containing protein [Terriglobia bacterium]